MRRVVDVNREADFNEDDSSDDDDDGRIRVPRTKIRTVDSYAILAQSKYAHQQPQVLNELQMIHAKIRNKATPIRINQTKQVQNDRYVSEYEDVYAKFRTAAPIREFQMKKENDVDTVITDYEDVYTKITKLPFVNRPRKQVDREVPSSPESYLSEEESWFWSEIQKQKTESDNQLDNNEKHITETRSVHRPRGEVDSDSEVSSSPEMYLSEKDCSWLWLGNQEQRSESDNQLDNNEKDPPETRSDRGPVDSESEVPSSPEMYLSEEDCSWLWLENLKQRSESDNQLDNSEKDTPETRSDRGQIDSDSEGPPSLEMYLYELDRPWLWFENQEQKSESDNQLDNKDDAIQIPVTESNELVNNISNINKEINNLNKVIPQQNNYLSNSEETYELEKFKKNAMIIFNHEHFLAGRRRLGTALDVAALQSTFEQFRFDVTTYNDLRKDALFEELDKFSKMNFNAFGCICVAILTHGQDHGYLRAYDTRYSERDVIASFDALLNPTLVAKPIIIIIQACRGPTVAVSVSSPPTAAAANNAQNIELDADETGHKSRPTESDMLIFHSSFFGRASVRVVEEGTWFIQTLCEQLRLHASTDHLEKLFRRVRKIVALEKEYKGAKQMPAMTTTLLKKLYLKTKVEEDGTDNKPNNASVSKNLASFEIDKDTGNVYRVYYTPIIIQGGHEEPEGL